MKVRAYVLFVAVALLAVSAGTKNAKPTVGINPGDFAPRIESLGTEKQFQFSKSFRTLHIAEFLGNLRC